MTAVGDDGEQNVVAGLDPAVALLDRLDAGVEHGLVAAKRGGRLGGHDLAGAGRDVRDFDVAPQIGGQHHVREAAEHGDQLRHIDEAGKARDRLVLAVGLQFELGRRVAERARPGVEFVQAALPQGLEAEQALHREHLAERIGDRGAGSEHQRAAWISGFDEARLHVEVPGALRAIGIDALQRRHVGRKRQFAEFLRLIDDDLIDADLGDGEEIVLPGRKRLQPFLHSLLQPFEPFARDAVVALDLGQQRLVKR